VLAALSAAAPAQASFLSKTRTFRSENWLHPPLVTVSGQDPDPGAGDLFVDVQNSIQAGPMILDPSGQLVWFNAMRPSAAFNLEVQNYKGQSVLTYWKGRFLSLGVNSGTDVVLDHAYRQIATVSGANGLHPDLHEFQITPQGTALIACDKLVQANLSSIGGPKSAPVLDQVIQEVDIPTGRLLWQWDVMDHMRLSDTYVTWPISGSYDLFHLNSIQLLPNGNLLVSIRHTWAVYEISKRTGRIIWQLGGKRSNFSMGHGTVFEWQHHAQLNGDALTVFDNGQGPGPQHERQSRAVRIRLNFRTRRASLVRAYRNSPSLLSPNEGSVQTLTDGNTFVGWGGAPYFSEFSPSGQQLFSAHFPAPMQSYRAYRYPWSGQPTTPPSVAAAGVTGGAKVYASWNGATDVSWWQVLAGPSPHVLVPVGQFAKTSFETAMSVANGGPYFAVQALGAAGQVLGTSPAVAANPPAG
jgi:hypothetical protein